MFYKRVLEKPRCGAKIMQVPICRLDFLIYFEVLENLTEVPYVIIRGCLKSSVLVPLFLLDL
jgi:hypothetical protein